MNREKLIALARTPRPITPELTAIASPSHPLYTVGCSLVGLGVLGVLLGGAVGTLALLAAVGVFKGLVGLAPYWWVGVALAVLALGPVGLGAILMLVTSGAAKKRGAEELAQAPLVLGAVVQGNQDLYSPGTSALPAVVVFSLSPTRALDADFVRGLAGHLAGLRSVMPSDPTTAALQKRLFDERATFDEPLPPALTGDAQTFWKVAVLSQTELPGGCIPPDRVVAFFCKPEGRTLVPVPAALLA